MLWPLTAGAICLWRMAATRGTTPQCLVESINLPRPGCEAPFSRICPGGLAIDSADNLFVVAHLAAFLRLVRAGYEPPLPPDQLELWLSSETFETRLPSVDLTLAAHLELACRQSRTGTCSSRVERDRQIASIGSELLSRLSSDPAAAQQSMNKSSDHTVRGAIGFVAALISPKTHRVFITPAWTPLLESEGLACSHAKSLPEKIPIQMITLIALSRLIPMKGNYRIRKKHGRDISRGDGACLSFPERPVNLN